MKPESCKGIIPDTPQETLSWRSATGQDYRDEVWDGVYHVVADKLPKQVVLENELECWLLTQWIAKTGGCLFRDTRIAQVQNWQIDFRVPSFSLYVDLPEGAYLDQRLSVPPDVVVEYSSVDHLGMDKIDFYCHMGVKEVWVIDVYSGVCVITCCNQKKMSPAIDNAVAPVVSQVTGIQIQTDKGRPGFSWVPGLQRSKPR